MPERRTLLFASRGPELTAHAVDVAAATLTPLATSALPQPVQYVWPHPHAARIYAVCSNGGPKGLRGDRHHACALAVSGEDGALEPVGAPVDLPSRPIHCTVDATGRYLLIAYNLPSGVSVHPIGADGAVGEALEQPADLDVGIFAHQIMMLPSNRRTVLVTRGNDAEGGRAEDPGALKLYGFDEGRLSNAGSIAPGDGTGLGFGPRHLDFHPGGHRVYVSVERQNQLHTYALEDDSIGARPLHVCDSMADPANRIGPQLASAVRVHPSARFVYQANRTDRLEVVDGWPAARGGENSLAVYALDPASGEPRPIQHVFTESIHVRTLSIDPSGRLLVAATIAPVPVRTGDGGIRLEPAALLVYRIGEDGRLALARRYDVDTRGATMFWTGMVSLA